MTRQEKLDRCIIVAVLKGKYGDVEILAREARREKQQRRRQRERVCGRRKASRENLGA